MPASAAAPPPPLTVLVLAWDAAAPAVRTLLEAAPGLVPASMGPVVVLVPPAAETSPAPAPEAAPAPAPAEPVGPVEAPLPAAVPTPASVSLSQVAELPAAAALPAALAAQEAAPTPAAAALRPAVRVTQLVYAAPGSLSQFASSTPSQFPAAPYLGATPPLPGPLATPAAARTATPALSAAEASYPASAPVVGAALPPGPAPASPAPIAPEAPGTETYTTDEALAPDLEADLLPPPAASEEISPLAPAQPAAATTVFSVADHAQPIQPDISDSFSLDAEALTEPATAAAPLIGLPIILNTNGFPVAPTPADDALAPTEVPLADQFSEAEPATVASPPLLPAPTSYPAPDLNMQVIRYARFAVPAALAEGPFGAIYAPAWPTWLAALELRQRTNCPLVLHLPALAAGRAPADTAAGWPAEIQRQALRQADLVLTETYALARRLRRELGLASTTVRVVPAADGSAVARALRRARRREATR